jgi:hypothetical protein
MQADRKTLVNIAVKTPGLKNAGYLRKLLQSLDEHEVLTADDIWEEVLEEREKETEDQRVRELVSRLRKTLADIAHTKGASQYLEIPSADDDWDEQRGKTVYRLIVKERTASTETEEFWRPHSRQNNVTLVYAEPVFYYDVKELGFIRYLDTNPRSVDSEIAIGELEKKHGKELRAYFSGELNARLRPSRVYVGIGDVAAMDMLQRWFRKYVSLSVRFEASDRVAGLQGGCPVLLGSERTNRFIENYLNSDEGKKFCFRQSKNLIGHVDVRNVREAEKGNLAGYIGLPGYSMTEEGPVTVAGMLPTISQQRERFVILTRMPVPGGKGWATMISCDSTLGVREVAAALVKDRELGKIFAKAGIDKGQIPPSFEMLFSVRIAPAEIEHEAGTPKLVGFRAYEN